MKRLLFAIAAVAFSIPAAQAQSVTPLGTGQPSARLGVPLGATELYVPGLSPAFPTSAPLDLMPGSSGITTEPGLSGGVGSTIASPPAPNFASSVPVYPAITNYGTGGMQPLPGSATSRHR